MYIIFNGPFQKEERSLSDLGGIDYTSLTLKMCLVFKNLLATQCVVTINKFECFLFQSNWLVIELGAGFVIQV